MTKARYIPLALAAAIAAGGVGTALAQNTGQNDTRGEASELAALQGAKVSLSEAIGIAEKEAGGKAVEAGIDDENGQYAYEVEVLGSDAEQEVLIDPASGKVTKIAKADQDEGDESDEGAKDEGAENEDDD